MQDRNNIMLDVKQILQNPSLPNGCEITSCTQVLNYLGYNVDKDTMADVYLPQSEEWYGADPNTVYLGNPHLDDGSPQTGYYCFAGPIVTAVDDYLKAVHGTQRGHDITGCGLDTLEAALRRGHPVIFWATLNFEDVELDPAVPWQLPDGTTPPVFHKLHCMVLRGMDEHNFYVADPLNLNTTVQKSVFMKIFEQLGRRAVVIY